MRINTNNSHVLQVNNSLMASRNIPELQGILFLLNGRLNEFSKNNKGRIETVLEGHKKLMEEYCVIENGVVKQEQTFKEVVQEVKKWWGKQKKTIKIPDKKVMVFKEGKSEADFRAAMQEFLNKENYLEV